jgi:uncharacterized protein
MSSLITQRFIEFARSEFRLDWDGIHGAPHWSRVRHNGLLLAEHTGANARVVEYFAFIHDLGRKNDHRDPEHGSPDYGDSLPNWIVRKVHIINS